jgi:hypothetical protein
LTNNRPKQIPTQLVNSISDHRSKEKYEGYFYTAACKFIRKLICSWAKTRIEKSVEITDNPSRLELPSYSEKQSYESGYRKAMRELLDLLDR